MGCVHTGPAVLCFSIEVLSDGQQETQSLYHQGMSLSQGEEESDGAGNIVYTAGRAKSGQCRCRMT